MSTVARIVGGVSCLVAVVALVAGLLYLGTSPTLGLFLVAIGVASMEGGLHLIRKAREPGVLAFSSPAVSGAIAVAAAAAGLVAARLGAARAPEDDPAWVTWALYAGAVLCGWLGVRAGWLAISGARGRRSA